MAIKVFHFEEGVVRVPDAWDYVTVKGVRYTRRRNPEGQHRYWVRADGTIYGGQGQAMQRND